MKKKHTCKKILALLPVAMAAQASLAYSTMPAQSPLLKRTSSVRPNVTVMLDNSGSMKDDIFVNGHRMERWQAVQLALRAAITKDKYDDQFRLAYGMINDDRLVRGVRRFSGNGKREFLTWLGGYEKDRYGNTYYRRGGFGNSASRSGMGTPLHQGVFVAGEYYRGNPGNTTWWDGTDYYKFPYPWSKKRDGWVINQSIYKYKPWDNSPTDTTKLSCRSASLILLSDGAWNAFGTYNELGGPYGLFKDGLYGANSRFSDNNERWSSTPGPTFTGIKDGKQTSLSYNPFGDRNNRELYIPYGDFGKVQYSGNREAPDSLSYPTGTNQLQKQHFFEKKLSDLTAYYYWHTDLRPDMKNDVVTGGPTFWQNMKTYTINFQVPPRNISYQSIANFESAYLSGDDDDKLMAAKPNWTPGSNYVGPGKALEDDTIQAGFTGGGRGYSPSTAAELEVVFDTILNDAIFGGRGDDAGVAVSGTPVYNSTAEGTLDGRTKYLVEYDSLKNAGDLVGYYLNERGEFKNVNSNGDPIPGWRASERLPAADNRQLYLLDPSGSRHTLRTNTVLDAASVGSGNFEAINPKKGATEDTRYFAKNTAFAKFMLGVGAQKSANGDLFRPLPKIAASVNSPALFVSYSNNMQYASYEEKASGVKREFSKVAGGSDYKDFFNRKYDGNTLIYTPTNSGIVHAFNGKKGLNVGGSAIVEGKEVGAYLPNSVMPKLEKFSKRQYSFEYLTDGPLIEQDIYDGSQWRQILFGTGGRGGQFAYALESRIASDGTRQPAQRDFLWEKSKKAQETEDMAYMTNAITAGQLLNGKWVMLVNSGHYPAMKKDAQGNDVRQQIGLYVLNALTGEKINFIPLPANHQAGNRGLGGVTAVRDVGRRIVAAYAGDAKGNLWRFDLRPSKMKISYGKPLFTAEYMATEKDANGNNITVKKAQPIYAAPAWQRHNKGGALPNGQSWPDKNPSCKPVGATGGNSTDAIALCGTMVAVGTGIMLDNGDVLDGGKASYQQALYGIWDPTAITSDEQKDIEVDGFTTIQPSNLLAQNLIKKPVASTNNTLLTSTNNEINYTDSTKTLHRGWKLNLDALDDVTNGERVITPPKNAGESFLFSSVVINDKKGEESCSAQRDFANILYGLNALSGGLDNGSFDADGDGKPDAYSAMFVPDGGYARGNKFLVKGKTGFHELLKRYTGPVEEDCLGCTPCDETPDKKLEGQIHGTSGKENFYADCPADPGNGWDGQVKRSWRQILNVPK